jgi:hypothetical protein
MHMGCRNKFGMTNISFTKIVIPNDLRNPVEKDRLTTYYIEQDFSLSLEMTIFESVSKSPPSPGRVGRGFFLKVQRRMFFVKISCILVNLGRLQHFAFAKQLTHKGNAHRAATLVKAVRQYHAWVTG